MRAVLYDGDMNIMYSFKLIKIDFLINKLCLKYNTLYISKDIKISYDINNELFEIVEQRNHEIVIKPKKL